MMKPSLLTALALCLLLPNLFASEDPHPDTLRVMSYNTWYVFGERNKHVAKEERPSPEGWVKSMTPDVVALQELTNIKPEKLTALGAAWGHPHSSLLKTSGFSVGLTSRWPIETVEKRLKGMHHGYLHAKTKGVHYILVHLSPFKWEVRQRESTIIMTKVKDLIDNKQKVILLGDFNAVSAEDKKWLDDNVDLLAGMAANDKKHGHVKNLKDGKIDYNVMDTFFKGGLKDTATGHLPESAEVRLSLPTGIWNKPLFIPPKKGRRVDFILATPELCDKVTSCKVITQGDVNKISDHYPVIADFKME